MSRFRPDRLPRRLRLAVVAVLGAVIWVVIVLYLVATVWLAATGRFEGVM